MIGYLCATPYHILAAAAMASDMFAAESSTLIVLDHFSVDDALLDKIRKTGVFSEVLLFHSNNKSLLNRVKRLYNTFVPHPLMRALGKRTDFSQFICFGLDFINIAYLQKLYAKAGVDCAFSFAEDGIGSYINETLYHPNRLAALLLRITGRTKYLAQVKTLYLYKPEYAVKNTGFTLKKIQQSEKTKAALRDFAAAVWPFSDAAAFQNAVLYFQQPRELENDDGDLRPEQAAVQAAADTLHCPLLVKLHPRAFAQAEWADFPLLKSRVPFEAILLQTDFVPKLLLTDYSTAVFSPYLLDGISDGAYDTIFLSRILHKPSPWLTELNASIASFCARINAQFGREVMHLPESEAAYQQTLLSLQDR